MADPVSIIASAITIAATGAQISLVLFSVSQTWKNAPAEIAEVAEELSTLSNSLMMLADAIKMHQKLCKPELFRQTQSILSRFIQVEEELKGLTKGQGRKKLDRLRWFWRAPKAKILSKKIESIKSALALELNIIQLAREQMSKDEVEPNALIGPTDDMKAHNTPNRFRKVAESIVQANRLAVENAKPGSESNPTHRDYTELQHWQGGSYDTATWLYGIVFATSIDRAKPSANPRILPRQPSVSDYVSDAEDDDDVTSNLSQDPASTDSSRALIVWNERTQPGSVVDRLLNIWTMLSDEQIRESASQVGADEWSDGLWLSVEEDNAQQPEVGLAEPIFQPSDMYYQSGDEGSVGSVTLPSIPDQAPASNSWYGDYRRRDRSATSEASKSVRFDDSVYFERNDDNQRRKRQTPYQESVTDADDDTTHGEEDGPPKHMSMGNRFNIRIDKHPQRGPERVDKWSAHSDDWAPDDYPRAFESRKTPKSRDAARKKATIQRRQAGVIALAERMKLEKEHESRVAQWEQSFAAFDQSRLNTTDSLEQSKKSLPTRSTSIRRGDQHIEVDEYATENLPSLKAVLEGLLNDQETRKTEDKPKTQEPSRESSDTRALGSFGKAFSAPQPQPTLLFSPHLDRNSIKTCELQLSLSRHGLPAEFETEANSGSRDGNVRCTISWEHPTFVMGSELMRTMRGDDWKPFYFRGSDAGQTYFLGRNPIHVNFFKPCYKPQWHPSGSPSDTEHLVISKGLVEEDALQEMRLEVDFTSDGAYMLDCQLTANDIEALVERSFMMRETRHRSLHRSWVQKGSDSIDDEGYGTSLASGSRRSNSVTSTRRGRMPEKGRRPPILNAIVDIYDEDAVEAPEVPLHDSMVDSLPGASTSWSTGAGSQIRSRVGKVKDHVD